MESISHRLFKEVIRAADIMGPIENEINYTTDELNRVSAILGEKMVHIFASEAVTLNG